VKPWQAPGDWLARSMISFDAMRAVRVAYRFP
jgi:hypothetical protein